MLELMLCDSPHIQYHPKDKFDVDKVKMLDEVRKAKMKQFQQKGLAAMGMGFNFKPATAEDVKEK